MSENVLEVTTNGKYNNIDLRNMNSGDSVLFTKKYAKAFKGEAKGKKEDFSYYSCRGTYQGKDVSFFMPATFSSKGYVSAEDRALIYDELGGEGDTVRITCTKGMGKDKKGKDIVTIDFSFELVN